MLLPDVGDRDGGVICGEKVGGLRSVDGEGHRCRDCRYG
jgi:hypothetical protein